MRALPDRFDADWTHRALASLRMGPCRAGWTGHKEYQPFVIVGDRRTGTNMLLHMLKSTGAIVGFAELFSSVEPFWAGRSYAPLALDKATQLRNEHPARFLDEAVYRRYPGTVRAVGFKAHYGQLEQFAGSLAHLRSIENLNVIHIRRDDMIAIHVSRLVAQHTGRRVLRSGSSDTPAATVTVDVAQLQHFLRRYTDNGEWPATHLPEARLHKIRYESLASHPVETLGPLLHGLGLESAQPRALTRQQNSAGWRAVTENVDEVERALRSTEWSHLLELES